MTPLRVLLLALLTLLSLSSAIAHPTVGGSLPGEQWPQRHSASPPSFQHPAGWHTAADIARVRSFIASKREPWKSATE
jgi:hypothetical protein